MFYINGQVEPHVVGIYPIYLYPRLGHVLRNSFIDAVGHGNFTTRDTTPTTDGTSSVQSGIGWMENFCVFSVHLFQKRNFFPKSPARAVLGNYSKKIGTVFILIYNTG